jgi:molecular chaperone GrpE (heat shock protein)
MRARPRPFDGVSFFRHILSMQDNDDVVIDTDGFEEGGSEEELEASASRVDAKTTKLKAELEKVKKEKQEYLDGWQRAKADYVNALKRFELEKGAAIEMGKVVSTSLYPGYGLTGAC